MSEKLTNLNMQQFLKDHLINSETIILEDGQEKDEILDIAKAKGYQLKDSQDLAGFKTIYTFADKANKNKARLPKEKLLKALPGIIGKPVDIDHIRNYVVGHYIDYRYKVKEDMVVAYGVFYKSNFKEEWDHAKQLFKANKLGTSYEIWCPKSKRKYLPDGTYELTEMEIAGGGLMFKEKPAFADAQVLELAKQHITESADDLVFASVKNYESEDLLTSGDTLIGNPVQVQSSGIGISQEELLKKSAEYKESATPTQCNCANCSKVFPLPIDNSMELKCPECFAIVDRTGKMLYPPQLIDFSMVCPSCSATQWRLLSKNDDHANVKCMGCADNYKLNFEKAESNELLNKISFVYLGGATCYQCRNYIPFSTTSNAPVKKLDCPKCNLHFEVDITKMEKKRKIRTMEKILNQSDNQIVKSSDQGGNAGMENKETNKPVAENVEPVVAPIVQSNVAEVNPEPAVNPEPVQAAPQVEAPVVAEVAPVEQAVVAEAPVVANAETPAEKPVVEKTKEELIIEVANWMDMYSKEKTKSDSYKKGVKKAVKKIMAMKKENKLAKASVDNDATEKIAKIQKDAEEKIELYKASAVTLLERRTALGDHAKDLSEKDILNDDKFKVVKLEKENADLKAQMETASSNKVTSKSTTRDANFYDKKRKEINDKAFKTNQSEQK